MGLFDFWKKEKITGQIKLKKVFVDNVYIIDIPDDWTRVESEKFRTTNKTQTVYFVATNFGKQLDPNNKFSIQELKEETLHLFGRFVNEGGYIANDDRIIGNDFIYQSFAVDEETQYYYYTSREGQGMLIRINFILKEVGGFKEETKRLLLSIGESIMTKIG